MTWEKILLVTRRTRLEELIDRFNTRAQAKFWLERAGGDFGALVEEHNVYQRSMAETRRGLEVGLKLHVLDRGLLPTCLVAKGDLLVTLGPDGLVANTAKYAAGQPILGVNPDPARIDGVLLPFTPATLPAALDSVLEGRARLRQTTMAEARLADGQRLLAFNDLFIGASTHVSARYRIAYQGTVENQSSSGILVATGAGSTGWLTSVYREVSGILSFLGGDATRIVSPQFDQEAQRLMFIVREPFPARHTGTAIVAGQLSPSQKLTVESQMAQGGVIFSDGVETDRLDFASGAVATIGIAQERAHLACR